MKPQRPKAKRTLADFLNRTDASDSTDAIADDPEIANTATVKPAHIGKLNGPTVVATIDTASVGAGSKPAASARGSESAARAHVSRTDLPSKIASTKRTRAIPASRMVSDIKAFRLPINWKCHQYSDG